jgi:hypothetical protein
VRHNPFTEEEPQMRLKRSIITGLAVSAIALTAAVFPGSAGADPGKEPPGQSQPSAAERRAVQVEAKAERAARLAERKGALGSYFDESKNQHVIVTGPDSSVSQEEASRAVGEPTRVEKRNITKQRVQDVHNRVNGRSWHRDAGKHTYASYLDLTTGKMVLRTDAPSDVTQPLRSEFGADLVVQAGGPQDSFSRRADTQPYWGGSSIKSGGGVCSAGFVVKNSAGTRYMLTAGHCFALGATVLTTDGNASVGTVVRRGPIPPYDMELIGGKSYGSYVFSGGTNSNTGRHVISAGDPAVNFTGYCRSGQTSGERCGQRVTSVTAQVCTQTGCKYPVIAYDTGYPSQPGDSGAPFYLPSGSDAHIRGMNIASGGGVSYAEKWSRISAHLGVSIVT